MKNGDSGSGVSSRQPVLGPVRRHVGKDFAVTVSAVFLEPCAEKIDLMGVLSSPRFRQATSVVARLRQKGSFQRSEELGDFGGGQRECFTGTETFRFFPCLLLAPIGRIHGRTSQTGQNDLIRPSNDLAFSGHAQAPAAATRG